MPQSWRVLEVLIAVAIVSGSVFVAADEPPEKRANGWHVHRMTSKLQAGPTEIKVLLPDQIESGKRYPVLYVLPVEANNEHRYGDGLAEVQRVNLHNKHGLICVAPTFAHLPWYADHPTDASIRQESYFISEVVPLVDRSYPVPGDREGRWLVGFSKSGWGAFSLLARHPDLFGRAAAWDAPLNMPRFDMYGAGQVFGNQEHFEKYRVLPALQNCKPLANSPSRLVLTGYDNFRDQHVTAQMRLSESQIGLTYRDGPQRRHVWNSGWVEEAVDLLAELKPSDK
jgi:S-formylglutathione hydrolase FrmB